MDHFLPPKATADTMPQEGINYMISKCSLTDDWNSINENDYGANSHHKIIDLSGFYTDVCDLMNEDTFFLVTEHFDLTMTPESFVASLMEME